MVRGGIPRLQEVEVLGQKHDMLKFQTHTWWADGKSFHKYMISLFRVSFLYFSDKLFILINQFNNLDLTIEENTLKHTESLI